MSSAWSGFARLPLGVTLGIAWLKAWIQEVWDQLREENMPCERLGGGSGKLSQRVTRQKARQKRC